jgi:1-deoxy-D-xylulose-5-phosphate reductoisomerase
VKKNICILGSTGSIGTQTLEIIAALPEVFEITYLTTFKNIELLEKQCKKFNPKGVVIAEDLAYKKFVKSTNFKGEILKGEIGITEAATFSENDLVISALVGFAGVLPTLKAIENGINIALANKETLVTAGKIITDAAKKNNVSIFPVDSEHSAIFQCLQGENINSVEKLILTASGGPFFNFPIENMKNITAKAALKHPTWAMGNKVTIDSATMMNKGFEVIEAFWLFGLELQKIEVVIHPQSIIHSLVQFVDGSVKAQLSKPDMRIPISFALTFPERMKYDFARINFAELRTLDFFEPNLAKFPCLKIAYEALEKVGNLPTIVNAANEIAVSAFCNEAISFLDIPEFITKAVKNISFIQNPNLNDLIETDAETRNFTSKLIK